MSDQEETEGPTAVPGPSGEAAEGTISPMTPEEVEAKLGSIADNDDVPNSEEEIEQTEAPINPEEAEEDLDEAEETNEVQEQEEGA